MVRKLRGPSASLVSGGGTALTSVDVSKLNTIDKETGKQNIDSAADMRPGQRAVVTASRCQEEVYQDGYCQYHYFMTQI